MNNLSVDILQEIILHVLYDEINENEELAYHHIRPVRYTQKNLKNIMMTCMSLHHASQLFVGHLRTGYYSTQNLPPIYVQPISTPQGMRLVQCTWCNGRITVDKTQYQLISNRMHPEVKFVQSFLLPYKPTPRSKLTTILCTTHDFIDCVPLHKK